MAQLSRRSRREYRARSPWASLPIHAALAVREVWRYDGEKAYFHELAGDTYRDIPESLSFRGLTPAMLEQTLAERKTEEQTIALSRFRCRWRTASA